MKDRIHVYDETLSAYRKKLMAMGWDRWAKVPGLRVEGKTLFLPFFTETLHVSEKGVLREDGKPASFEICVVVYNYLLRLPEVIKAGGDWVSFRDTKHAGPLTVYFANDVEKKIAGFFGKKDAPIMHACGIMGGRPPDSVPDYDVAMAFDALPGVPLLLLLNQDDDDFPVSCRVLFRAGVEQFLDTESLAILGAVFAARLCSFCG